MILCVCYNLFNINSLNYKYILLGKVSLHTNHLKFNSSHQLLSIKNLKLLFFSFLFLVKQLPIIKAVFSESAEWTTSSVVSHSTVRLPRGGGGLIFNKGPGW